MAQQYWYLIVSNALLKIILFMLLIFHLLDENTLWAFFTIIIIIITFVPTILRRFIGINLPLLFDFFISLALLFHVGNGLLDHTSFIFIYNKFTHFFSAVVVAFLALIILYVVHEFEGDIVSNKKKVLFDIIIITIALGVVWELLEWGTDYLFGLTSQVDLDDTMVDLFADTLGGIFMSYIGYLLIKRNVLPPMAKDIKDQIQDLLD